MPKKRRDVKSKTPVMSDVMLYFVSRGLYGTKENANPFELLELEYPLDAMREKLQAMRAEFFKTLTPAEQKEFLKREIDEAAETEEPNDD